MACPIHPTCWERQTGVPAAGAEGARRGTWGEHLTAPRPGSSSGGERKAGGGGQTPAEGRGRRPPAPSTECKAHPVSTGHEEPTAAPRVQGPGRGGGGWSAAAGRTPGVQVRWQVRRAERGQRLACAEPGLGPRRSGGLRGGRREGRGAGRARARRAGAGWGLRGGRGSLPHALRALGAATAPGSQEAGLTRGPRGTLGRTAPPRPKCVRPRAVGTVTPQRTGCG